MHIVVRDRRDVNPSIAVLQSFTLHQNAVRECEADKFSDIHFIIGEQKSDFPAIRGIFAMHCPYFAEKMADVPFVEDDMKVTAVGFTVVKQYLYRLNPVITVENAVDVLYAASKYELTELVQHCNDFLNGVFADTTSATYISHILLLETRAIHMKLSTAHPIRQRLQKWLTIETNSTLIIESKAFMSAPRELVVELIQYDSFSVTVCVVLCHSLFTHCAIVLSGGGDLEAMQRMVPSHDWSADCSECGG